MSEETGRWCQTSKGQHDTGRKHLCFPPKYVEALRSGNPLRAELEQTNHWDNIIYLPSTCICHGNIFPCDAGDSGECLPAGELQARDYPSLSMRPHWLLHPVLSSLRCRKGTGKREPIQSVSKMVRGTDPMSMCWGTSLSQPGEEETLGAFREPLITVRKTSWHILESLPTWMTPPVNISLSFLTVKKGRCSHLLQKGICLCLKR